MRLVHWLVAHLGVAIASNYAVPQILELYQDLGFKIRMVWRISCKSERRPVQEMLAFKC